MQERVKLTPLTQEERMFSEENYPVLEWCIRINRIDQDYYDIAYLGYIHAVKKWYAREDLHRYSFKTIANAVIRTHISNEKKKEERRIQTISLEEVIPGIDGLTYGDTITEENIRFLKEACTTNFEYDVDIPQIARAKERSRNVGEDTAKLIEFLYSEHKNMCIEYPDRKIAIKKASYMNQWKKRNKRTDFRVFRYEEKVYFEKITSMKGTRQDGKCKDQPVRD